MAKASFTIWMNGKSEWFAATDNFRYHPTGTICTRIGTALFITAIEISFWAYDLSSAHKYYRQTETINFTHTLSGDADERLEDELCNNVIISTQRRYIMNKVSALQNDTNEDVGEVVFRQWYNKHLTTLQHSVIETLNKLSPKKVRGQLTILKNF